MSCFLQSTAKFTSFSCHLASYACLVYSGLILGNTKAKCSDNFFCTTKDAITEMKIIGIWAAAYLLHSASTFINGYLQSKNVRVEKAS